MEWIILIPVIIILLYLIIFIANRVVLETIVEDENSNGKTKILKPSLLYYYLPESILRIRANVKAAVVYNLDNNSLDPSSRIIEQSFTVSSEMIADTSNLLTLNYSPNIFFSDNIKFVVNQNGLLETVNFTTEDKITEIVTNLVATPKAIIDSTKAETFSTKIQVIIKEFTSEFVIKASSISNTPSTITWNIIIPNEQGNNEFITLKADFNISLKEPLTKTDNKLNLKNNVTAGILTRPLINIELIIESLTEELGKSLPINTLIADYTKLIIIPLNRTAFVKRINNIALSNGLITSNEITKPSSFEGFISIPINIAKAIVSIPAQLIQFKFDNTKRLNELEKERLAYERSIQDSKKFAIANENEIEKVKLEIEKNELTNQNDIKALKLTLNKNLLEAEMNQLKAEKDLNALKKEIEQLKGNI